MPQPPASSAPSPPAMYDYRVHGKLLFRYGYAPNGQVIVEVKCNHGGNRACKDLHLAVLSATMSPRWSSSCP